MKKYITLTIVICLSYVAGNVAHAIYPENKLLHNYNALNSVIDDEQYLIFVEPNQETFGVLFPNGKIEQNLTPEMVAYFLKNGEIKRDEVLQLAPGSEYQMSVTDEYILLKDGNREVTKLRIENTGKLEQVLINDNL